MAAPTATEQSLMEQLYPGGGWRACAAVMPDKKAGWITQWAWKLGLTESMRESTSATPVPTHEYTSVDLAMREWGHITRKGQLVPMIRAEIAEAA